MIYINVDETLLILALNNNLSLTHSNLYDKELRMSYDMEVSA